MLALLQRFGKDCSGATAIEYALIAGGIFLAIVSIVGGIGTKLTATFTTVNNGFSH